MYLTFSGYCFSKRNPVLKLAAMMTKITKFSKIFENWRKSRKMNEILLESMKSLRNDQMIPKSCPNRCAQRKIEHPAWWAFSLSWSMSLREFKTYINLGGPAGSLGHPDGWPRAEECFRYMTRIASSYRVIRPSGKTGYKWAKTNW